MHQNVRFSYTKHVSTVGIAILSVLMLRACRFVAGGVGAPPRAPLDKSSRHARHRRIRAMRQKHLQNATRGAASGGGVLLNLESAARARKNQR